MNEVIRWKRKSQFTEAMQLLVSSRMAVMSWIRRDGIGAWGTNTGLMFGDATADNIVPYGFYIIRASRGVFEMCEPKKFVRDWEVAL